MRTNHDLVHPDLFELGKYQHKAFTMWLFDFLFGRRKKIDLDGSSPATAIVVQSVAEEYQWIQKNCPGFMVQMQALTDIDGKPYDVLTLRSANGEPRAVYFDISSFFGH